MFLQKMRQQQRQQQERIETACGAASMVSDSNVGQGDEEREGGQDRLGLLAPAFLLLDPFVLPLQDSRSGYLFST